ncbi:putative porin [Acinetobacter sp. ANC 4910]|uniref:putative porin n=1 Tax=Acinetobacter sp. ANC 4910 TaxID=2529850 RepID=UPI00103D29CA|nr:putative porin [Acinetobacter sp. ANC 4910]TCB35241.1 putative porin [Acinetobacter sp. ANC 4910]
MKQVLASLALALMASSSFAYDAQIDTGFSYFDRDDDITDAEGQFDLTGTVYFNPVMAKNAPLNEAAFLGHNSNASLSYTYNYWDSKTLSDGLGNNVSLESKAHHIGAGIEYFVEQFYLNGQVGFGQAKDETNIQSVLGSAKYKDDYDATTYRALVGYMPISNLLLATGIDGYQGDEDNDDNRFALAAKYVAPVGQGQFINLEADAAWGDIDNINLAADYYFDPAFSFGLAYHIEDDGDDNTDFFSVRSKYFLNPNFAVGGAVGFGDDVQGFNVNATLRF